MPGDVVAMDSVNTCIDEASGETHTLTLVHPDQADAALGLTRQIVADFVAKGPTEAELKAAKDNLIGGFPLRLDSNGKLLDNVANIAWNGLPLDYLEHWTDKVQAVTADDVRKAFARVLQPERMVTVVLGAQP